MTENTATVTDDLQRIAASKVEKATGELPLATEGPFLATLRDGQLELPLAIPREGQLELTMPPK